MAFTPKEQELIQWYSDKLAKKMILDLQIKGVPYTENCKKWCKSKIEEYFELEHNRIKLGSIYQNTQQRESLNDDETQAISEIATKLNTINSVLSIKKEALQKKPKGILEKIIRDKHEDLQNIKHIEKIQDKVTKLQALMAKNSAHPFSFNLDYTVKKIRELDIAVKEISEITPRSWSNKILDYLHQKFKVTNFSGSTKRTFENISSDVTQCKDRADKLLNEQKCKRDNHIVFEIYNNLQAHLNTNYQEAARKAEKAQEARCLEKSEELNKLPVQEKEAEYEKLLQKERENRKQVSQIGSSSENGIQKNPLKGILKKMENESSKIAESGDNFKGVAFFNLRKEYTFAKNLPHVTEKLSIEPIVVEKKKTSSKP